MATNKLPPESPYARRSADENEQRRLEDAIREANQTIKKQLSLIAGFQKTWDLTPLHDQKTWVSLAGKIKEAEWIMKKTKEHIAKDTTSLTTVKQRIAEALARNTAPETTATTTTSPPPTTGTQNPMGTATNTIDPLQTQTTDTTAGMSLSETPTNRTLHYEQITVPQPSTAHTNQTTANSLKGETTRVPFIHCFRGNYQLMKKIEDLLADRFDEADPSTDMKAPFPDFLAETLDPATQQVAIASGDIGFASCATMLDDFVKAKLMYSPEYVPKGVRQMNPLYTPPEKHKDDPKIQALLARYEKGVQAYKDVVGTVLRKSVRREYDLHCLTLPQTTIDMIHDICKQRAKWHTTETMFDTGNSMTYSLLEDSDDSDTEMANQTQKQKSKKPTTYTQLNDEKHSLSVAALATLFIITDLYGVLMQHSYPREQDNPPREALFDLTLKALGEYAPQEVPLPKGTDYLTDSENSTKTNSTSSTDSFFDALFKGSDGSNTTTTGCDDPSDPPDGFVDGIDDATLDAALKRTSSATEDTEETKTTEATDQNQNQDALTTMTTTALPPKNTTIPILPKGPRLVAPFASAATFKKTASQTPAAQNERATTQTITPPTLHQQTPDTGHQNTTATATQKDSGTTVNTGPPLGAALTPTNDPAAAVTRATLDIDDNEGLPLGRPDGPLVIGGRHFTMPCWKTYQAALKTSVDLKKTIVFLTITRRNLARRYLGDLLRNAALGKDIALRRQMKSTLEIKDLLSMVDQQNEKTRLESFKQMMKAMRKFGAKLKSLLHKDDHSVINVDQDVPSNPPPPHKTIQWGQNHSRTYEETDTPTAITPATVSATNGLPIVYKPGKPLYNSLAGFNTGNKRKSSNQTRPGRGPKNPRGGRNSNTNTPANTPPVHATAIRDQQPGPETYMVQQPLPVFWQPGMGMANQSVGIPWNGRPPYPRGYHTQTEAEAQAHFLRTGSRGGGDRTGRTGNRGNGRGRGRGRGRGARDNNPYHHDPNPNPQNTNRYPQAQPPPPQQQQQRQQDNTTPRQDAPQNGTIPPGMPPNGMNPNGIPGPGPGAYPNPNGNATWHWNQYPPQTGW